MHLFYIWGKKHFSVFEKSGVCEWIHLQPTMYVLVFIVHMCDLSECIESIFYQSSRNVCGQNLALLIIGLARRFYYLFHLYDVH